MPAPVFDYSKWFRQTGLTDFTDLGNVLDGKSPYDLPNLPKYNPYAGVLAIPGLLPNSPISPAAIKGLLSPTDPDDDDDDKPKSKSLLSLGAGLLAAGIPKVAPPMRLDVPTPQLHRPEAQPLPQVDFRALPIAPPRKRRPILPVA